MKLNQSKLFKKLILGAIALVAACILPYLTKTDYTVQIFVIMLLYATWATAWNIIGGYAGQLALGNGLYIGIGAYVTAVCFKYLNISPWLGMFIAGLISGLLSTIVSFPCFKLHGIYYALSTACMLQVGRTILIEESVIFGFKTGAAMGIKLPWYGNFIDMQFDAKVGYYYVALGLLLFCLLISYLIQKSKMGYYLQAINTNQMAASSLGVNVMMYKLYAQFISSFLTAMGGGVYCMLLQFVEPNTVLAYQLSTTIVLLVVVGGRGTLIGPVVGAFMMVPIDQVLRAKLGGSIAGLSTVIYGVVLMLVVMFLPEGVWAYLARFFRRIGVKLGGKPRKEAESNE